MRWSTKPIINVYGEIRHIKRFLFLPREINNEVRWLEFTWITQVYRKNNYPTGFDYWEDYLWDTYKKSGDSVNYY